MLTAVVHCGYAAILVQAFVVTPPINSFRPCGCTIYLPEVVKHLTLLNLSPATGSDEVSHADTRTGPGQRICKAGSSDTAAPILTNLHLSPQLEMLIFDGSKRVDLCVTISSAGKVTGANASSLFLSRADERRIEDYIVSNWIFTAAAGKQMIAGSYPLIMGVREVQNW